LQARVFRSCSHPDEPRKDVVRHGRSVAKLAILVALAQIWGCGQGPRNFRKIANPAPLTRARAVGLGGSKTDSHVLPALVGRLDDTDPVVRLAAYEELRKRTGQDFGFVPWASPEERTTAVARWRAWIGQGGRNSAPAPSMQSMQGPPGPGKPFPAGSTPAPNP
jgi:hypothetical protein